MPERVTAHHIRTALAVAGAVGLLFAVGCGGEGLSGPGKTTTLGYDLTRLKPRAQIAVKQGSIAAVRPAIKFAVGQGVAYGVGKATQYALPRISQELGINPRTVMLATMVVQLVRMGKHVKFASPRASNASPTLDQRINARGAQNQGSLSARQAGTGNRRLAPNKIPWDSWQGYKKVNVNGREYAQVGDRLYTRHAVDRMQPSGLGAPAGQVGAGRSIAPQYVENVIQTGTKTKVTVNGAERIVHQSGTVEVITESDIVITVNPFKLGGN